MLLTESKRINWIDTLKGIGILCVVIGHINEGLVSDFIFIFHMPLFFFIAGYLFKPSANVKDYFLKKVIHLLLPYIAMLFFFFIIQIILNTTGETLSELTIRFLWGGNKLGGKTGVFWFVTCFFLTQQLFNLVYVKCKKSFIPVLMTICLTLSYINYIYWQNVSFPWAINNVLYTLPIFYFGVIYKNNLEQKMISYNVLFLILSIAIGVCFKFNQEITIDIKSVNYGVPLVSLIFGFILLHCLIIVSKSFLS